MNDYEKQQTKICGHPELLPTQWNQTKPPSCEMTRLCDCGANQSCPVCGWGQGSMPCPCRPYKPDFGNVKRYGDHV